MSFGIPDWPPDARRRLVGGPAQDVARRKAMSNKRSRRLREKAGYETNVPRCETCSHFQGARMFLVDSLPRFAKARCGKFEFQVANLAVCDHWIERHCGATLEQVSIGHPKGG